MLQLLLLLLLLLLLMLQAQAKFKSLHCQIIDKNFGNLRVCEIKAINRTKNVINISYDLYKTVENDVQAQVQLFKRANGWHPFLYNFKLDVCKFLKKPNNLIGIIAFKYLKPFTNINHTCPFMAGSPIIVKNFELDVDNFRQRFPIDNGEYALTLSLFINKILVASFNGSIYHFNYKDQ
ncbi:uncharacterized protein LOC117784736 [Drosophila innubila]|uniref:uncharacterized protein LOC117784736 n=1 Tax=Drosophila innubila TaxID=198719 RepID=UPI00148B92DF|nr:uncharacterized protein LOC117784736 [Drosophila innubila]